MAGDESKKRSPAERYVESYLSLSTQEAAEASTDNQLATIAVTLAERIGQTPEGAVVDIGCGQGTLLKRLTELPQFRDSPSWLYLGIDEEDQLTRVQDLARKSKINRRVEVFNLEEFYAAWPDVPPYQIVVCRNVLHELRIVDTARLIHHVASSARPTDTFIVQDLIRFPVSERHNACWVPDELHQCMQEAGFVGQRPVVQGTRTGNAFFNLIAAPPASAVFSAPANGGCGFESPIPPVANVDGD